MTAKNQNETMTRPLTEGQRWSAAVNVKWSAYAAGKSVDALSRVLNIEIYCLEEWRVKALTRVDESLKKRQGIRLRSRELSNSFCPILVL